MLLSKMMNLLIDFIKPIRAKKIVVCIYACYQDEHLLKEFYVSPVAKWLARDDRFTLFEVFADGTLTDDLVTKNRVTLCVEEQYRNLPQKTFNMIRFFTETSKYDYILKIDVTTLTTALKNDIPTGGKKISTESILELISDPTFLQHYNGYSRVTAQRRGAENWAKNKTIKIDYDRVFDSNTLPNFFSGKLWLISHEFAKFIVSNNPDTLDLFTNFFPAEDVMIGYIFTRFEQEIT